MRANARRVAFLAALTAVGTLLLLLAGVLPAGRIAVLALASLPVCVALMQYGFGWAAGVYVVTGGLGFLLFPGAAAIAYAAFFGWYPLAKSLAERLPGIAACWAVKGGIYLAVFAAWRLLGQTLFPELGQSMPWYLLLAAGAAVFWVYDRAYSLIIGFYLERVARYFQ